MVSEPRILRRDDERTLRLEGVVETPVEVVIRDGPLSTLLEQAGPLSTADHGTVVSGDGHFTASIPLGYLQAARLEDGRLQVPDAPTKCWNVKDVVRIELTEGPRSDSVPDY